MDKILIQDLLVQGIIGVLPHERVTKQDILVNVTMFADLTPAGKTDDLTQSVSYAEVADKIIERIETGSDLLVEKLAFDLARMILTEHPIERVKVRVEKPMAVTKAKTVGVEIERTVDDFRENQKNN